MARGLGGLRQLHHGDPLGVALKPLPCSLQLGIRRRRRWLGCLTFRDLGNDGSGCQKSDDVAAIKTHEAIIGPASRAL